MRIELPLQGQHYVPRGYLKQFTFDGHNLYRRYKNPETPNTFKYVNIGSICCLPNYYDLHGTDLSEKYDIPVRFLEQHFQTYENLLPHVLGLFKTRVQEIDIQFFGILVDAYLSIKHRNPFTRNQLTTMLKDKGNISVSIDNIVRQAPKLPLLAEAFGIDFNNLRQKAIEHAVKDEGAGKKTHLSGLVHSAVNRNDAMNDAIMKLSSMQVQVIEAPDDHYFFTSDNPGFTEHHQKTYNTNFGAFDTIFFPINSKQMVRFIAYNPASLFERKRKVYYTTIKPEDLANLNTNTLLFASQQVFCTDRKYMQQFEPTFRILMREGWK